MQETTQKNTGGWELPLAWTYNSSNLPTAHTSSQVPILALRTSWDSTLALSFQTRGARSNVTAKSTNV